MMVIITQSILPLSRLPGSAEHELGLCDGRDQINSCTPRALSSMYTTCHNDHHRNNIASVIDPGSRYSCTRCRDKVQQFRAQFCWQDTRLNGGPVQRVGQFRELLLERRTHELSLLSTMSAMRG